MQLICNNPCIPFKRITLRHNSVGELLKECKDQVDDKMAYKTTILCIFVEILFCLSTIAIAIVLKQSMFDEVDGLQPFKRGFYCDDSSIKYPLVEKEPAVDLSDIFQLGIVVSLAMILTIELELYYIRRQQSDTNDDTQDEKNKCGPLSIPSWIIRMLHRMCIFVTGGALVIIFFGVTKALSGRLRPNFLALCKPNNTLFNCSDGYITADVCTGDPLLVKRARMSMPSGHTALAFYFAVFVVLCLQSLVYLRKYRIAKMAVQTGAVLLAAYASIDRVTHYNHHVTDVLVGGLIGSVAAWMVVFKAMKLFQTSSEAAIHSTVYRQMPTAPTQTDD